MGRALSKPSVLQVVLAKIVTEILFGNAHLANHETTVLQQITDQRTKKDRDLDHARAMGGIVPESGEVLTHHHHMFNKRDTKCRRTD